MSWWVTYDDAHREGTEGHKDMHTLLVLVVRHVKLSLSIPGPFITEVIPPFMHV